jgi:hypothetical protein
MNQTELRNYFVDNTTDFFSSRKLKPKRMSQGIEFMRKTSYGQESVLLGITNYNPVYNLHFSVVQRNSEIIQLMSELKKSVGDILNFSLDENTWGASFSSINNTNRIHHLPKVRTFTDLDENIESIIDYLDKVLLPLSEKHSDINELNKEINIDNFWDTDWHKKVGLCGNFEYKRIIVAYLSNIDTDKFDFIIDKQTEILQDKTKGEYGDDFKKVLEVQKSLLKILDERKRL